MKLTTTPSTGSRLAGIEGMRAIAASSILVYHVWIYSTPGGRAGLGPLHRVLPDLAFGVTLFFVLSGFLLYRPFVAAIVRDNRLPRISFYLRNRALRILPAYWAILLLCSLVFGAALSRHGFDLHFGYLTDPRALVANALFFQSYSRSTIVTGIGPAWSLCVEVVFYLALPLLVLGAFVFARRATSREGRRLAALAAPALLLALGLAGRAADSFVLPPTTSDPGWDPDWHSVLERSFLVQCDLFAFGMALAILRVDAEDGLLRLPSWWRKAAAATALGAYLVTARLTYIDEQLNRSPYNTLMGFSCALLLALVVLPKPNGKPARFVRLLETRPLMVIGLASYSLFLWHEPVVRWLTAHGVTQPGNTGFLENLGVVGAVSLLLAWATYRLVEVPALRRKRRTSASAQELAAEPVPADTDDAAVEALRSR